MKALEESVRAIEMEGLVWGLSKVSSSFLPPQPTSTELTPLRFAACASWIWCQQAPDHLGCRGRKGVHRRAAGANRWDRGLRAGQSIEFRFGNIDQSSALWTVFRHCCHEQNLN